MNATFLQIVNNVLIKINETQLTDSNFAGVIGVHAMVKLGVLDTILKINQVESGRWPFYAVEQTSPLVPGEQEYAWADNFASVDWKSFQIQKDDAAGYKTRFLTPIEREQWYRYMRDTDYNVTPTSTGLRMPEYVFSAHGYGFGVSPSPDKAYNLKYRYFKNPVVPELSTDELPIPPQYNYVLHLGGLVEAYRFFDNTERSQSTLVDRDAGIKDMTRVLIGNNFEHVYAGQINNTGSLSTSRYPRL